MRERERKDISVAEERSRYICARGRRRARIALLGIKVETK